VRGRIRRREGWGIVGITFDFEVKINCKIPVITYTNIISWQRLSNGI